MASVVINPESGSLKISENSKIWKVRAPSNIALIKYMGKSDGNVPCNTSLSYALEGLYTEVTLRLIEKREEASEENRTGTEEKEKSADFFENSSLSEPEVERFLKHLRYVKKLTNFGGQFYVVSRNSFPMSAGIASSASSFAALTMCAFKAISDIRGIQMPSKEFMGDVSRVGSGSSCRSFFSPWCIWRVENGASVIEKVDIPLELDHRLILVDTKAKEVLSSEAHRRVQTSLLMERRAERAEMRCEKLIAALRDVNWQEAYQICWEDFWDMHALFETSNPAFGYMLPKTLEVLRKVRSFWKEKGDGPIATVDAGPNVHLLWRKGDKRADEFESYLQS